MQKVFFNTLGITSFPLDRIVFPVTVKKISSLRHFLYWYYFHRKTLSQSVQQGLHCIQYDICMFTKISAYIPFIKMITSWPTFRELNNESYFKSPRFLLSFISLSLENMPLNKKNTETFLITFLKISTWNKNFHHTISVHSKIHVKFNLSID